MREVGVADMHLPGILDGCRGPYQVAKVEPGCDRNTSLTSVMNLVI